LSENLEIHFLELEKIKKLKHRPKDDIEAWMLYLGNLHFVAPKEQCTLHDAAQWLVKIKFKWLKIPSV
jgi:hypothetical protein